MSLDEDFDKVVLKDENLVTCDNEECPVYGDMWWCYLGNERSCRLYKEFEEKLIRKSRRK